MVEKWRRALAGKFRNLSVVWALWAAIVALLFVHCDFRGGTHESDVICPDVCVGRDNGGGRLITTEFEPSKIERAKQNLTAGGLVDLVEFREGDALQTLSADLPDTIELLLLDGAKSLYPDILSLVESRLKPGALIVADNTDSSPDYLAHVRSAANGYLSVPFGDGVELSMRIIS